MSEPTKLYVASIFCGGEERRKMFSAVWAALDWIRSIVCYPSVLEATLRNKPFELASGTWRADLGGETVEIGTWEPERKQASKPHVYYEASIVNGYGRSSRKFASSQDALAWLRNITMARDYFDELVIAHPVSLRDGEYWVVSLGSEYVSIRRYDSVEVISYE